LFMAFRLTVSLFFFIRLEIPSSSWNLFMSNLETCEALFSSTEEGLTFSF
jgi:hypothetical protein